MYLTAGLHPDGLHSSCRTKKSMLDENKNIDENHHVIALGCIQRWQHSKIFVEGMYNNGQVFFITVHLLLHGAGNTGKSLTPSYDNQTYCGRAGKPEIVIWPQNLNLLTLSPNLTLNPKRIYAEIDKYNYTTWQVSSVAVKNFFREVDKDRTSLSYSFLASILPIPGYDNCLTWAIRKLEAIGVIIDPNLRFLPELAATGTMNVPAAMQTLASDSSASTKPFCSIM